MSGQNVKATIKIGDNTVTFEGPAEFVDAQVAKYARSDIPSDNQVKDKHGDISALSERQIVELKKPKNHSEIVAVLAFFLTENGSPEFSEEDIRRAYLRAGVRPPKVASQALRDAKNNFDYIESSGRRGSYRLTSHGDRTVRFDLPRPE